MTSKVGPEGWDEGPSAIQTVTDTLSFAIHAKDENAFFMIRFPSDSGSIEYVLPLGQKSLEELQTIQALSEGLLQAFRGQLPQ